ncbi:MAG: FG-GAP-like repeat-containing protein [Bacteroidota bacterium]
MATAIAVLSLLPPAKMHAQETFLRHDIDIGFAGAHALQSHDLDNDGDLDIIGAGLTVDAISWWENDPINGLTWTPHTVSDTFNGARFVDAADLDGDGDLDLFGAAASDDLVSWWENTSGDASAWTQHPVDIDFDFAMHLHAADLDADGDLDLMGAALKGDAIHWWENTDGDGSVWTEHIIDEAFDGARHVCSVDLDGDGDLDLLGSAYIADDVKWWENTAGDATTWELHTVDEDFDGVNVVMPVDIDGDNDVDLLGAADVADDIVVWFNEEGDGLTWERVSIAENFDGAFSIMPADMDGDGDTDVLGAATEANQMVWWENKNGLGNSWDDHIIDEEFDSPMVINVADLDADGDLDVIGGSFGGEIVWWETDPPALPVELVSFDAVVNRGEVVLRWETASELNNAGFELQHKPGPRGQQAEAQWGIMGFVKGAGTDNTRRKYQRVLSDLQPGNHRFRLKQIDFDGAFDYSPVVEVVLAASGKQTMSSLYPNPFNPAAKFYLTLASQQEVNIEVYNALGQRVTQLFRGVLEANQVHTFDFEASGLPGGLYLINATGQNFSTTQRAMYLK